MAVKQSAKRTVSGYKFNHLAINSTTAVAAEARVNPALLMVHFNQTALFIHPDQASLRQNLQHD